jgi:hypothetical protein
LVDSVQAPRYTVAVGLLLYAAARETHDRAVAESVTGKIWSSVKRWLLDFF